MPKDIVVDVTNTETESMSKIFNNPNLPVFRFLSQELQDNIKKLEFLEKKITLSNTLLIKSHNQKNQAQLCKLKKEKEGFEEEKINLTISIKKLKCITDSIKDFILFYIFIKRFYTLAIKKENFELKGKNISVKLINNLKSEEENLYNEFIDGDCFSKVLLALSFEPYQCYFKSYAKNFFDNIQHSNKSNKLDPNESYVNSLLILQAVAYECDHFNVNLNLSSLKLFLSQKILTNIHLPSTKYELIALRCFFYYELLFEFLNLKLIKTNLEHLKKSINLQLSIVNYKANTKDTLIFGLNDLQEAFGKTEKKYNDFLGRKSDENKEADVNKALVFYNKIEDEVQAINKKTINLFNNKYINATKMRQLLAILVNEAHLPKFLEKFNAKIGNDFSLNNMNSSELLETNQEALNYLFHAICRDKFYIPLNTSINLFISETIEIYPKDDSSILDSIEFKDLIEFSFYYIFTLLYTDFNASLKGFNNKLLYTELVTLTIFTNMKFEAIKVLENRRNKEINKFIEYNFENKTEYATHKKDILEEIKLNLEIIHDTRRILFDTKSLENSLIPKLEPSSKVPMPEKNLLINSLKTLEEKQKICELEYQKIEKHTFINKAKPIRKFKNNEVHTKKASEIEYNKAIEYFYESLIDLSENLSESLKHIKENTQDIDQFRQKISSTLGQLSLSIEKLLSNLNAWKNPNEISDLTSLSLPELLKLAEELVIKNTLIDRKNYKKKLTQLQEVLNNLSSSTDLLIDQVNSLTNKYYNYNNKAKKILNRLSTSFIENHSRSQFFGKSMTKKIKRQINGKLSNDYIRLKEQSNWLEKIIRLIKCDTDDRVIKLYTIIVEADDYQKACELLNGKINFLKKHANKKFNKLKFSSSSNTKNSDDEDKETNLLDSSHLFETYEATSEKLCDAQIGKIIPVVMIKNTENEAFAVNQDSGSILEQAIVEKKYAEENIPIEAIQGNLSNNSNLANKTFLVDYEDWNLDFEKWKNENQTKLYELFHIVESCSKSVLNGSGKAFLKCLSQYQKEFSAKNDELRMKKSQISLYFEGSNQVLLSYLAQYQKWFDEIFHRIILCRTLILQNENDPVVQESPRLPSALADNRAEFKNLLTFYLGATDEYNKLRDDLIIEENKLNSLNRNFIKQTLMLGSLDRMDNKANGLSDFSKQLDRVNQLKLAIEQKFEIKQKIKKKLSLLTTPEVVKFYLSRIDPCDADSLKNTENYLSSIQTTIATNCVVPILVQECNVCAIPATFYCLPSPPVYPVDGVQLHHPIYYSM
ncbi:MAG: hypothetical protein WA659_05730 [Candidatus Aquirickettsiella sp.]